MPSALYLPPSAGQSYLGGQGRSIPSSCKLYDLLGTANRWDAMWRSSTWYQWCEDEGGYFRVSRKQAATCFRGMEIRSIHFSPYIWGIGGYDVFRYSRSKIEGFARRRWSTQWLLWLRKWRLELLEWATDKGQILWSNLFDREYIATANWWPTPEAKTAW